MGAPSRHDHALLDALDVPGITIAKTVWRITRSGRDPLRGSALHGRWGVSGEFSVLYTSCEKEGALAEIGYRLGLEPVWPSRIEHTLHELEAHCENVLDLTDMDHLATLGVDISKYASLDYSATSRIASAAAFLEFSAILVPCARYACNNLVIFTDRPNHLNVLDSSRVDWKAWQSKSSHPTSPWSGSTNPPPLHGRARPDQPGFQRMTSLDHWVIGSSPMME